MSLAGRPKKIPLICRGHSRGVVSLSYSNLLSDGSFFMVSGCLDGQPMLRDGATGDWIGTFLGHKGAVWSARLDGDATKVVTAAADCTAKLWSALDGNEIFSFPHKKVVKSAVLSANGQILTGGHEKELKIFDLQKPEVDPTSIAATSLEAIRTVLWCKSDTLIAAAAADKGLLCFWDPRSDSPDPVKQIELPDPITSLETCFDGNTLIYTAGKTVYQLSLDTLEPLQSYTQTYNVSSAHLDPRKKVIVVAGQDSHVRIVSAITGEELENQGGHHGPVHCIRFAPDGKTFASGSEDGTIRIWLTKNKPYQLWTPAISSVSEGSLSSSFTSTSFMHDIPGSPGIGKRHRARSALSHTSRRP